MSSVVVCEDVEDIVALVADVLVADGHDVRTVTTVAAALAALAAAVPDVLVCDLWLPDGSGVEVCEAAARAGARVVVVTAVPPQVHPAALARWADVVLAKPFGAAALRRAVAPR